MNVCEKGERHTGHYYKHCWQGTVGLPGTHQPLASWTRVYPFGVTAATPRLKTVSNGSTGAGCGTAGMSAGFSKEERH